MARQKARPTRRSRVVADAARKAAASSDDDSETDEQFIARALDHPTLIARRGWEARAACKGADTDAFFPSHRQRPPSWVREMCQQCPVRMDCLLDNANVVVGIFAGLSRHDRVRVSRAQKEAGVIHDRSDPTEGIDGLAWLERAGRPGRRQL